MKIDNAIMRESWIIMIAKVEKYFPGSKQKDVEEWQFVVSPKKEWMFDVINKVRIMATTVIDRKCKKCGYLQGGWCYWLGRWRDKNQYECEDGYMQDNPY